MYIIVGLGNPERKYAGTRHNIGFSAITAISDAYGISMDIKKHKALCGKGMIAGNKVLLAMPQTYMNLSGESVRELVDFYKIDPEEELIIIYDDIALLGRFPAEEEPTIRTALEQTVKACETILTDSVEAAMNQFNGK